MWLVFGSEPAFVFLLQAFLYFFLFLYPFLFLPLHPPIPPAGQDRLGFSPSHPRLALTSSTPHLPQLRALAAHPPLRYWSPRQAATSWVQGICQRTFGGQCSDALPCLPARGRCQATGAASGAGGSLPLYPKARSALRSTAFLPSTPSQLCLFCRFFVFVTHPLFAFPSFFRRRQPRLGQHSSSSPCAQDELPKDKVPLPAPSCYLLLLFAHPLQTKIAVLSTQVVQNVWLQLLIVACLILCFLPISLSTPRRHPTAPAAKTSHRSRPALQSTRVVGGHNPKSATLTGCAAG